jgi:hypothetical protein
MIDFMDAIKKPFSDKKTLGIGTIIGAIPVLNVFVTGYALKVAEDTVKGNNKLRAWAIGDIIEYIIKIIMMYIISAIYFIIPMILIAIGVGGAMLTIINGFAGGTTNISTLFQTALSSLAVGAPLIILGGIIGLIAVLLLPMATVRWLKAGKITAAFNIIAVIKNALTMDYIVALIAGIIYAIVLTIVATIISVILGLIPVIGVILMLLIQGALTFLLSVTMYTMIAQTVK